VNDLLILFLLGGAALVVVFTLTWVIQLRTGNAAIIDVAWSASFPILAIIYFVLVDGFVPRQLLVLGLTCVWGFRLAIHLYHRMIRQPGNARYIALRQEWGSRQPVMMLGLYYFQASVALILSIPFALIMVNTTPSLNSYEVAGALLLAVALIGETIADQQLKEFKINPANKGKICDKGLWFYSRHPNYFFEWLVWVAYCIMSLGSAYGYLSVISPLAMYYLLTKVTGIPHTERQMLKSMGKDYEIYQRGTSAFVPLPKNKWLKNG
jgi:steroid 5-alpha reductase family enzyme